MFSPPTHDDPRLGRLRHDPLIGWHGDDWKVGDARLQVFLGAPQDSSSPPLEILGPWLHGLHETLPELLRELRPLLLETLEQWRGPRERLADELRPVAVEVRDAAGTSTSVDWCLTVDAPRDGLRLAVEMRGDELREIEAEPSDGSGREQPARTLDGSRDVSVEEVAEFGVVALAADSHGRVPLKILSERPLFRTTLPFLLAFAGLTGLAVVLGPAGDMPLLDAWQTLGPERRGAFVASGLLLPGGLVLGLLGLGWSSRMRRRATLELIRGRGDAIVTPDDSGATYTEIVGPWAQDPVVFDAGLLRVDARRELLLFEGSRERWAIRRRDVTVCALSTVGRGSRSGSSGGWKRIGLMFSNRRSGQRRRAFRPLRGYGLDRPAVDEVLRHFRK